MSGSSRPLRVALGEYDTGWEDPATSLGRAAVLVERAAADADLVVLPEMCASGFSMATARVAEPITGPSAARLADLARAHGIHLLAGLAVQEGSGAVNAAVLFGPDGALVGTYRKQRLFAHAGEDAAYHPGGAPLVVRVGSVWLAPFICYDLRFPELFRAVAERVDLMVLIANWPASRQPHWDALLPARAIENQCYMVAVNRTGEGGGTAYAGGSGGYDPWGDPVGARSPDGGPTIVEVDPAVVARTRSRFRFVADRRGQAARGEV